MSVHHICLSLKNKSFIYDLRMYNFSYFTDGMM